MQPDASTLPAALAALVASYDLASRSEEELRAAIAAHPRPLDWRPDCPVRFAHAALYTVLADRRKAAVAVELARPLLSGPRAGRTPQPS